MEVLESPSLEVFLKKVGCGTWWHGLAAVVVLGYRLDLMISTGLSQPQ